MTLPTTGSTSWPRTSSRRWRRTTTRGSTLRRALAAGLPFGVELHALPVLWALAAPRDFEDLLRMRA